MIYINILSILFVLYNIYILSKNYLKKKNEVKSGDINTLSINRDITTDLIYVIEIKNNEVIKINIFDMDEYETYRMGISDSRLPIFTILNLDTILDKINEKGIENITEEEKMFLDNYNKY